MVYLSPNSTNFSKQHRVKPNTKLSGDFSPGSWSVVSGRGKETFNHTGNRRFRILLDVHRDSYMKANCRARKSLIVQEIVESVRDAHHEGTGEWAGAFVKKDPSTGCWVDVGDLVAREKVGDALREPEKAKRRKSRQASTKREPRGVRHNKSNTSLVANAGQLPMFPLGPDEESNGPQKLLKGAPDNCPSFLQVLEGLPIWSQWDADEIQMPSEAGALLKGEEEWWEGVGAYDSSAAIIEN